MDTHRLSGSTLRLLTSSIVLVALVVLTCVVAPAARAAMPGNDDISHAVSFSQVPVTFTTNTKPPR